MKRRNFDLEITVRLLYGCTGGEHWVDLSSFKVMKPISRYGFASAFTIYLN